MSISPRVAAGIGVGLAATVATANTVVTFKDGQEHDATLSTGDQATWDRKIAGAALIGLATVPVSIGAFALSRSMGLTNASSAKLGMATLMAGLAGTVVGNIGSMVVD